MPALSSLLREVSRLSDLGAIERVTTETVCVQDTSVRVTLSAGLPAVILCVMKTERLRLKQPRVKAVRLRKGRRSL